jgi:hypothetical protein
MVGRKFEGENMAEENSADRKWRLNMGCHRGTLMSRDSNTEEYDSLEACKSAVASAEKFWASIGYFVWFANAYGPDGEQVQLHVGTSYRG